MAIMSVEVPDSVAKRFAPYTVVHWKDINMEEQLLKIDGDGWERSADFGAGVPAKEVLAYLEKTHG